VAASAGHLTRSRLGDSILRIQELCDYTIPFSLRVVCQLGLPDLLVDGPKPIEVLSARTQTDTASLLRVMRALASREVFTELEHRRFALTPLSELLRSDHPLSLREAYPLMPGEVAAWGYIEHSVRSGRPAFDKVHGVRFYDYLPDHPEESERFDRWAQAVNRLVLRTVLPAYDWGSLGSFVDVGGGTGAFLAGLLSRYKTLRGVLFDLDHVVAKAGGVLEKSRVVDRCSVVAGSFFDEVPAGYDGYVLKTILHDWDDADALAILERVRAAMRPDSRLLVLEGLPEPGNDFDVGKLMAVQSLVLVGAPDRGLDEFEALLTKASLALRWVTRTETLAIIEAVPT
jgi:SAM-dependent methyltransferase